MDKKTLVIGASEHEERYSNKAIRSLRAHGHTVVALGKNKGQVGDVTIQTERLPFEDIDTITLYINPSLQKDYVDYLLSLKPKRIIFNPGAENESFERAAKEQGVATLPACTLVLLSTGQF